MPATAELGDLLIVGDPELDDRYIAVLMKLEEHVSLEERSPVVQVLFVLRYPMQRAILWTDKPYENPAVGEGVICRLSFFRAATVEEVRRFGSYAESLKAAQEEKLLQARREGDESTAEIILRHMRGEYARKRVLLTYKRWEI